MNLAVLISVTLKAVNWFPITTKFLLCAVAFFVVINFVVFTEKSFSPFILLFNF